MGLLPGLSGTIGPKHQKAACSLAGGRGFKGSVRCCNKPVYRSMNRFHLSARSQLDDLKDQRPRSSSCCRSCSPFLNSTAGRSKRPAQRLAKDDLAWLDAPKVVMQAQKEAIARYHLPCHSGKKGGPNQGVHLLKTGLPMALGGSPIDVALVSKGCTKQACFCLRTVNSVHLCRHC